MTQWGFEYVYCKWYDEFCSPTVSTWLQVKVVAKGLRGKITTRALHSLTVLKDFFCIDSGIFAYLCQVCEWEAKWIHSANRWRKGCSTLSLASQVCLRNSNSKNDWRKRTWLNARASWASSSISISMCFPIQHTHIYIVYNYIYRYHISMNHLWICLSGLSISQSIYLASIHSCSTMFGMTNNRICTKVWETFNLYQANSDRRMQPGRLKCAVGMLWKHTMVDSCINGTITHVVIQFTTHHKPILDSDKEAWPAVRYCDQPQATYTYWSAISYSQDAMDSTMHGLDHCYFKNIACAMHRPIHSPLVHPSHPCHRIFLWRSVRFPSCPILRPSPLLPSIFRLPPNQYLVHSLPLPALMRSSVFRLRQSSVNFLGAFLIRARTQFPDVAALVLYGG